LISFLPRPSMLHIQHHRRSSFLDDWNPRSSESRLDHQGEFRAQAIEPTSVEPINRLEEQRTAKYSHIHFTYECQVLNQPRSAQ